MASKKNFIQESAFPAYDRQKDPQKKAKKESNRQRLAEKLNDPEFRKIEGFPIGTDEAILALSDPPYYTACPNPFLDEILEEWQQERRAIRKELGLPDDENVPENLYVYQREPFAADVSEGKNDPIYNAHSYHTKVPHKAIMRYILHYTDPGDIVFDGFCGTGMTGVAAQLCGDKKVVESLGYRVDKKGIIYDGEKAISRLGTRKAVLNDLSPAATFIAYNYNTPVDVHAFEKESKRILKEVEEEYGWMYETWHPHCDDPNRVKAKINYTVWSDVFRCPQCGKEMVFWDVAVDFKKKQILNTWNCPSCDVLLSKNPPKKSNALRAEHSFETFFDSKLQEVVTQSRQVLVLINYSNKRIRYNKIPDPFDNNIIIKINNYLNPYFFPVNRMPIGGESRRNDKLGITHVHHFYNKRVLLFLSSFFNKTRNSEFKNIWASFLKASLSYSTKLVKVSIPRLLDKGGLFSFGLVTGTLYVPSLNGERAINQAISGKIKKILKNQLPNKKKYAILSTQSSTQLKCQPNKIDYIFIDPPFGSNLMYSELNFLWEAWINILTNSNPEAIINNEQNKNLYLYQKLIKECLKEFYRIIKPGRWITIEFHNTQNSVWNAIQEALLTVGFVIADVSTLDKKQATFKQVTSSSAVKQDLIISAYKPKENLERIFNVNGGSKNSVWSFLNQHLDQLPMPTLQAQHIDILGERMHYLLYDRMVAFHLVRGLTVPLSAAEFYQGLDQRYLIRDGMVFTPLQATRYDQMRMQAVKVQQLTLFVTDEASAIQWLRMELYPENGNGPQTYSELMPRFLKQLHQDRYQKMPELQEILTQNFFQRADGHWEVPDPDNAAHLEQNRQRELLRDFNDYLKSKGRLKVFRSEAVRTGFSKAWGDHDYATIIQVAERLPEQALQEDQKLKLYYDNALNRADKQPRQERLI